MAGQPAPGRPVRRPAPRCATATPPRVGRPAIAYCGSGVTACHDLLAMHVAGITDLALYAGSWSQWGADPSRPAETGTGAG